MPEATDKDTVVSLFEPMSPDALDRQRQDFPLNEPLTPTQRKEALDWLLSPNGGGVSVHLAEPYNNPEIRDALIESLLLHSWFAPSKDLANRIPLKGTSSHKVGSSTIPLTLAEEPQRKIDIVVKPSKSKGTRVADELGRIRKFKERGIPTVEPFGVIDINDSQGHASYMMTVLKKGIVPLQKINFEQLQTQHQDRKMRQLIEVMQGLATFTANMHNQGIAHGDFYLRNVAMDLGQGGAAEFVVFDVERSVIMGDQKLGVKNKVDQEPPQKFIEGFRHFEIRAEDDIVNLAADISVKNDGLPRNTIFRCLIEPYMRARTPSHGRLSNEAFLEAFDEKFNARIDKLEKARLIQKTFLEAIEEAEKLD